MEIEGRVEKQNKEPLKIKVGEWLSPFQKPEDLPGVEKDVEILFTLGPYGQGRISMERVRHFDLENQNKFRLRNAGNKPLTLTVEDSINSNSGESYWALTRRRAPMSLAIDLDNIPQHLVKEIKDRKKRTHITTGLKCFLEFPGRHGKVIYYSSPDAIETIIMHENAEDTTRFEQFFGGEWKSYDFPLLENSIIYFPDDDPELFKQIRIKFEKTRIRKLKEIINQKPIEKKW